MRDLVLRTRLDVLEKNLEQVKCIVTSLQERRRDIGTLLDLLADRGGTIKRTALFLQNDIHSSKRNLDLLNEIEEYDKGQVDAALQSLSQAEREIKDILDSLASADLIMNSMLDWSVQVEEGRDLGKMLGYAFVETATNSILDLRGVRGKLEEARQAGDQAEAGELVHEAWTEYNRTVYPGSQQLFAEYVDLLGGLALRDTLFEEDVCRLGDELVRKWASDVRVDWDSLTIPAYRESLSMTPARIIRLGFPEWTLWALPLTAHEFGHVVVRQDMASERSKLKELIEAGQPDERTKNHREEYVADAIAAYAMGPAYACAAILLRFDPLLAYQDQDEHPAYAKRTRVIFSALEWINSKDGAGSYRAVIDQLRDEWNAALGQVHPADALQAPEIGETNEWLEELWDYLYTRRNQIMYSAQDWASISDWSEKLLDDPEQGIRVKKKHGLRDVLNTAWDCRINNRADVNEIADAAMALWKRIVEKGDEALGRPLGRTSPRPNARRE